MGILDRFTRRKDKGIALEDDEKAYRYEQDPTREPKDRPASRASRFKEVTGSRRRYLGNWAPHPNMIRGIRFVLYSLTSLAALTTAAFCISVVVYYNTHGPVIKPAWGSLIADIVFGIGTPGVLFGMMLVLPRLFRHGGALDILNQTRMELLTLFGLAVVWVSGALALACDLRGQENCLWDGYWHYPKPSDFQDACNRINWAVALAYTTFGLTCLQMAVIWAIAGYILLFLDQEVLTEHTNSMGSRAYLARSRAQQQHKVLRAARQSGVSTMGPSSGSGRRSSSFGAAVGASLMDDDEMSENAGPGPMAGGVIASRSLPNSQRAPAGPMMGGSAPHVSVTNTDGTTLSRPSRSNSQGSNVRFTDHAHAHDDDLNEAQPVAASRRAPAPGGMWSSGAPRLGDEERAAAHGEDPFEDQRGGYYGYENEAGLTSERDRHLHV
ncbi:hypothetical protein NBRC10512_000112 [Rhodotorula toruloides]|uniref:RHTO0S09e06326g1_1 n=2 Tax=Rhodotorula toruloides TaxID=5286 RepID=A0A061B466_RHOTO|nr:uncharacterized protein RHTO_03973 [Rhodotorula toruloides NP11]EMS19929.1 hypothetical protein RHTO_03973 [Rhodotorula toruloides NP11]CDR44562.1 RHTO0S09e06326g1_1 [Rhodotorula toruloides]